MGVVLQVRTRRPGVQQQRELDSSEFSAVIPPKVMITLDLVLLSVVPLFIHRSSVCA